MEDQEKNKNKIAIVGLDCRLPGANNSKEFWNNLVKEIESLTNFTEEELIAAGVPPRIFNNPNYVRRRGIVRDAEMFELVLQNARAHRLLAHCQWMLSDFFNGTCFFSIVL